LAKKNYSFEKRQRELAKKKKKEQKTRRKLDKGANMPEDTPVQSPDDKNA